MKPLLYHQHSEFNIQRCLNMLRISAFVCFLVWSWIPVSTVHASSKAAANGFGGVLSNSPGKAIQAISQSITDKLQDDIGGLLSAGIYYGITHNVMGSFGTRSQQEAKGKQTSSRSSSEDRRHAEFTSIGRNVERWAEDLLNEKNDDDTDGWNPIQCNKALKNIFNPCGTTQQYVKWMRDSREVHANRNDKRNHPCMKLYATIDAPYHIVCRYLSQEHRYREYNSLLIGQKDIEQLTPDSKICWSQTKKLLFIQPRDFVTYCYHRWKRDGTQVIVSQACDHPEMEKENGGYRAYALRGATYIHKDPTAPTTKTKLVMLAHCNCGDDIPEWAVRTAVGVMAPIKPFEIIHRIRVGVEQFHNELLELERQEKLKQSGGGRCNRPAGIAQMGYACFWPTGGGIVEEKG